LATDGMDGTDPTKKSLPPHIVGLLIVFWPVGLFLLYRHNTSDRTNLLKNANISLYFGIGFLIAGLFETGAGLSGLSNIAYRPYDPFSLIMGVMFLAGGVAMVWLSVNQRSLAKRYKRYIALIVNNGICSLERIVQATGFQYPKAAADLQKMIDLGFFDGAYLDEARGLVVLPEKLADTLVVRSLHCDRCGANNKLTASQAPICAYCGSPLE